MSQQTSVATSTTTPAAERTLHVLDVVIALVVGQIPFALTLVNEADSLTWVKWTSFFAFAALFGLLFARLKWPDGSRQSVRVTTLSFLAILPSMSVEAIHSYDAAHPGAAGHVPVWLALAPVVVVLFLGYLRGQRRSTKGYFGSTAPACLVCSSGSTTYSSVTCGRGRSA